MPAHPLKHCCHDYKALIQQWKALAKRAGLRMKEFGKADDWGVFYVESPVVKRADLRWRYICAGLHGDEAAPPWGLLEWAERNVKRLMKEPFLIFPAMNPIGLLLNTRLDQRGVDLNRVFNSTDDPLMIAWRKVVGDRKIEIGLCLHEDYDGQGCYLYELTQGESVAAAILRDTAEIVPTDMRKNIDGRKVTRGVLTRRLPPPEFTGYPEAIMLHYLGAPLALTFESPSEFCLTDRIAVQRRFIESAIEHGCRAG